MIFQSGDTIFLSKQQAVHQAFPHLHSTQMVNARDFKHSTGLANIFVGLICFINIKKNHFKCLYVRYVSSLKIFNFYSFCFLASFEYWHFVFLVYCGYKPVLSYMHCKGFLLSILWLLFLLLSVISSRSSVLSVNG